ncbi:protein kinase domain-containing protein [Stieleria varia]|uniref:Serine/threonine-protein kinase PknB n=1 Tax=Stieleria varia TaxID=2528005 RepID=A0A5C6B1X2_9BACT|nr:Hsp70 family protein [Stieleria varia]TWU05900.1 Serine/threonine-protein kinase PknB [Stieleria varia]
MSSSSDSDFPINDQPTRDFGSVSSDDDLISGEIGDTSSLPSSEPIPSRIGDYEIRHLIGSGGMGEVYLAEHVRMQRKVAVKVLRKDKMQEPAAIERFYDEVRVASRLMHPNIVAAFDAGEFDGIHYLTMEYVDGLNLTRLVSKKGPFPVGMAAAVIRQAAMGLLHAHRAGIVHRDVKPGNLMQASDGTIKVLDLGLAQINQIQWSEDGRELGSIPDPDSHHKRKGKLVGTLAYMAPEQLESPDDADPRSDIYSLGAVLFFLLTARPPFTGDYLEQVYGHRHGAIPDLMQERDDISLGFANIFRRMMAKKASQRYASMDEVIEDLSEYADDTCAPSWITEFRYRQNKVDVSTASGGSTAIANMPILAIDLDMFYATAAEAVPGSGVRLLSAGNDAQPLFRMAFASDNGRLICDSDAIDMRTDDPKQVVHCLPMYIGKDVVDREVCGRKCPPEVLLGLAIQRVIANAWPERAIPRIAAIVVPACYDQFHRRSIVQAARIAGLESIRLVDRSVASVQSTMLDPELESLSDSSVDVKEKELILYLGLTGQATEIALIRRDGVQLTQLATAGHWHTGGTAWLHRLVDLAAKAFVKEHKFDPKKTLKYASRLQMACERAINSMLLLPEVIIGIDTDEKCLTVTVSRDEWLERSGDLIYRMRRCMHEVCTQAGVSPKSIQTCITMGPLLHMRELHERLLHKLSPTIQRKALDRPDAARGAAACLAAELPGRSDLALPPQTVASQSIGIVIADNQGRRRILPIIQKGTPLPARTNRKLSIAKDRQSMTLSIVETSGVHGKSWHSLGRYEFEVDKDSDNRLKRTRMIGFELNVNGLLTVRAQTPGTPESTKLSDIPISMLNERDEPQWQRWISDLVDTR